jgi:hypothetical protein
MAPLNSPPSDSIRSVVALRSLIILTGIGALIVMVYALAAFSTQPLDALTLGSYLARASVGLLVAGASLGIGGILGFLFGIPRTLQGTAENRADTEIQANTNLEQISDWLTKILVGVGLTQLAEVPALVGKLATSVGGALGGSPYGPIAAIGIILYFLVCGFLFSYLWTRLFLPGAFREAERAALRMQIAELGQQPERDAHALNVVQRQLEPRTDTPLPTQQELNDAVRAASALTRLTIYEQARRVRKENWQTNKTRMEDSIPVFRALIAADANNHLFHGQLGFALKDKRQPDYPEAEAVLTKAIEVRGPALTEGHVYYELNRAICWIEQDPEYRQGRPSTPAARDRILADLRTASGELLLIQPPIASIQNWMQLNGVSVSDLTAAPAPPA